MTTIRHRHRMRTVLASLTALMLIGSVLPVSMARLPATAGESVVINRTDLTMQTPRGTPETVIHYAQAHASARMIDTVAYIREIYRLAPLVGIDPAFVVSQSALETADWTSTYWSNNLNPAGIGIGYSGAPSYTWATGTAAARYHLVHLYIYVAGAIDPGNPLYPYRADGPGYVNAVAHGYSGQCHIIDDLTGRWAADPQYGQKIANRGNAIFTTAQSDPDAPAHTTDVVDASAGNDPARTRDGNTATSFAVTGIDAPPPSAFVQYDLGRRVILERIQWLFRLSSYADSYQIQLSNDQLNWTTAGSYTNPPANQWIALPSPGTASYVRVLFSNPNGDMTIGYLAEIEFYGVNASGTATATSTPWPSPTFTNTPTVTNTPTATNTAVPTGTAAPTKTPSSIPGALIPIVGSGGSGSGNWSGSIRDGSIRTTWQTITSPAPSTAQVYIDLGASGTVTGVEFMFRRTTGARSYQIRTSADKHSWTTAATYSAADPLVWQRARFTVTARYIQFVF